MRIANRRIVTAYIVSSDGKLLLGRKNPKRGGVDEGETDEQALKREVLEETGINISDSAIEFIDDKGRGESVKTLDSSEQVLAKMHFRILN